MRVESHPELVLEPAAAASRRAMQDVRDVAFRTAAVRTGAFRAGLSVRVTETGDEVRGELGSSVRYATPYERGAEIRARNAPALVFDAGDGVRKARLVRTPAHRTLERAGETFPEHMDERLREAFR